MTSVLCALTATACSAPATAPKSNPAAHVVAMSEDCQDFVAQIGSLWDPTRDGTAGYADAANLAAAPSLYDTSWSLQLAAFEHWPTGMLERASLVSTLNSEIGQAATASGPSQLSEVSYVDLAVRALSALGAKTRADDVVGELEPLLLGGRYAPSKGSQPSWAATYTAVDAITASGGTVPAPVTASLETEAASLGSGEATASGQSLLETDIPVVAALAQTVSPSTLTQLLPDLADWLAHWQTVLMSGPVSAVPIGADVTVHQIAERGRVPLSAAPLTAAASLVTSGGYLALSPGASNGDPQVTFDAAELGLRLGGNAQSSLQVGLTPLGWQHQLSAPELIATYQAVIASRQCGELPHPDVLPAVINASTQQLATEYGSDTDSPSTWLADAARLCALGSAYGLNVGDELGEQTGAMIAKLAATKPTDVSAVGIGLDASAACSVPIPATEAAAFKGELLGPQSQLTALNAQVLADAGRALGDPALTAEARADMAKLKVGDLYKQSSSSKTPDIASTEIGYGIAGALGGTTARTALEEFMVDGMAAEYPARQSPGGAAVDLTSLESGALLEQSGPTGDVIW